MQSYTRLRNRLENYLAHDAQIHLFDGAQRNSLKGRTVKGLTDIFAKGGSYKQREHDIESFLHKQLKKAHGHKQKDEIYKTVDSMLAIARHTYKRFSTSFSSIQQTLDSYLTPQETQLALIASPKKTQLVTFSDNSPKPLATANGFSQWKQTHPEKEVSQGPPKEAYQTLIRSAGNPSRVRYESRYPVPLTDRLERPITYGLKGLAVAATMAFGTFLVGHHIDTKWNERLSQQFTNHNSYQTQPVSQPKRHDPIIEHYKLNPWNVTVQIPKELAEKTPLPLDLRLTESTPELTFFNQRKD
ncbi:MAG: hypothetical protein ACMXYF_02540 [Candidatus Woesearchaeota archaeon]